MNVDDLQPLANLMAADLTEAIYNGMTPSEFMCVIGAIMEAALEQMGPSLRNDQWKFFVENMNRKLKAMP